MKIEREGFYFWANADDFGDEINFGFEFRIEKYPGVCSSYHTKHTELYINLGWWWVGCGMHWRVNDKKKNKK